MSVIAWEDPPLQLAGRKRAPVQDNWAETAATLRTRPGIWAVILEADDRGEAANLSAAIRMGRYPSFHPTLSYEATYRTRNGKHLVYARYVGHHVTA